MFDNKNASGNDGQGNRVGAAGYERLGRWLEIKFRAEGEWIGRSRE